ncbi:hypothetical protein JX265_011361 [Neoarthrinium moseri]|uniref:Uncharacterized protein n=1 Tax=Neoarthrinium moseri TaxID=1658444 RepID=A0A9Q0AJM0_9PEZI|nr:hypothetical protein JX265_011361 [Neoarthrinium moseri]
MKFHKPSILAISGAYNVLAQRSTPLLEVQISIEKLVTDIPLFLERRGCPNTDPNAFGGVAGCITLVNPPDPTNIGATTKDVIATGNVLPPGAAFSLVSISKTGDDSDPKTPATTEVTWLSSDIPITTTGTNGQATTTTTPAWVCLGSLCNPECTIPVQKCDRQDGVGIGGFPWPTTPDPSALIPPPSTGSLPSTTSTAGGIVGGGTTGGGDSGSGGESDGNGSGSTPVGGNGGGGGDSGDGNGNTPGGSGGDGDGGSGDGNGNNPGGGGSGGGGGGGGDSGNENDPTKTDAMPSSTLSSAESSTSTSDGCTQTVSCTQKCVISTSAAATPTTSCETDRQKIECTTLDVAECRPITTSTATTTTQSTVAGGMCDAGSCGCWTPPSNILQPTNSPGERLPSITDFPSTDDIQARKSRRAPAPPDSNSILRNEFEDPGPHGSINRQIWYGNALQLIRDYGAGNLIDTRVGALMSSKMWSVKDLAHPFITGGGPSWGCTTVLVFSDRGIWLGHFWEGNHINIQDDAAFDSVALDFIRNGRRGQPSLSEARSQYFGNDPDNGAAARFVHALIFTPNAVNPRSDEVPTWDHTSANPNDPWWFSRINRIKDTIKQIVPEVGENVEPATYAWYGNTVVVDDANSAELGIAVWEYVPGHVHQNDAANQCANTRAIRVHVQGRLYGPWTWPWPVAANTQSNKRGEVGICPSNIGQLLQKQDPNSKSSDSEFYDPDQFLKGSNDEQPSPSSTVVSTKTAPDNSPTSVPSEQPSSTTQSPPKCSHVAFGSGGVVVGSGCSGYPPDATVTYSVARRARRALPATFVA